MTVFARPEEDDLVNATSRAIKEIRMGRVRTDKFHEQVKSMYSWTDVAERTERVYEGICRGERVGLMERLKRYYGCGVWAGKLFVLCVVVDYLIWVLLEFLFPRSNIDIARGWPRKAVGTGERSTRRDRSRRREGVLVEEENARN
jgi:phosphatidylinositol glycan class A protein